MPLKHAETSAKQTASNAKNSNQSNEINHEASFSFTAQGMTQSPHALSAKEITILQRTIGNQATLRLLNANSHPVIQRNENPGDQGPASAKPQKEVSSLAMGRLAQAQKAIAHTKSVFSYGAGNQREALKKTNFNATFRLQVMRGNKYWKMTDEVKPIAAANPTALQAAKADIVHGGNCGEHAAVAFDYLRIQALGETINLSSVKGLDHAFVLIGNIASDGNNDLVAADAWPTRPSATTWEDHFAYTPKRADISIHVRATGDGKNAKAVIAAGLTLTDEGKALAEQKLSDEDTDAELKKGMAKGWIWDEADASAPGKDYEYVSE